MANPGSLRLTDEQVRAVMTELCGGSAMVEMLTSYHAADPMERMSLRELAMRHGRSKSAVKYRMTRARDRLRRCGLLPPAWEDSTDQRLPARLRRLAGSSGR